MRLSSERVLRFLVVAEELSLTRAASLLNVDQPWLSRQIIQLEEQLGFALFDRKAGRIVLTPDGAEFQRHAKAFGRATSELSEHADAMQRRHKLTLRIGVAHFTYWFESRGSLLNQFHAVRPEVNTETSVTADSGNVLAMIHDNSIDVGLVIGPVDDPEVEQLRIECGETSLSIPPENPLSQSSAVSLSDLRGHRVAIGPSLNERRHATLYGWVEKVGAIPVEVPEGRRFMADMAQRERLIMLNLANGEPEPVDFKRCPIHGSKPQLYLYAVRRKGLASTAVDRFWRVCEDFALSQAKKDGDTASTD